MPARNKFLHIITKQKAKDLNLKRYFDGKECIRYHIDERYVCNSKCAQCAREDRAKQYYENHEEEKNESRLRAKERAKNKPKKIKPDPTQEELEEKERKRKEYNKKYMDEYNKRYYEENRDKIIAHQKSRMYDPNVKESRKKYIRKWAKDRRKTKEGAIESFMRKCISRLMGSKKPKRTSELLGYSKNELLVHIESIFEDWMSWENYGEWHIDHIVPISWFVKNGISCPKK